MCSISRAYVSGLRDVQLSLFSTPLPKSSPCPNHMSNCFKVITESPSERQYFSERIQRRFQSFFDFIFPFMPSGQLEKIPYLSGVLQPLQLYVLPPFFVYGSTSCFASAMISSMKFPHVLNFKKMHSCFRQEIEIYRVNYPI